MYTQEQMVILNTILAKSIKIVSAAFVEKTDKSGTPYVMHCFHVMNQSNKYGIEYAIVGILHDLIEDTEWTITNLVSAIPEFNNDFCKPILESLNLLTHMHGDSYAEYVKKMSGNLIAVRVKKCDLEHNSQVTRMKGLRDKDLVRIAKYHKAYAYLTRCEQNLLECQLA